MKRIFEKANEYVKTCDWKDIALLKFCLFSMGILIGTNITCKKKKAANIIAAIVFLATYIPLMSKFIPVLLEKEQQLFKIHYNNKNITEY